MVRQWEAGRQWERRERRAREGGHTTQHGHMRGDNGRQDLGKADTPSNTGTHVGRQWERRGDKTSGKRTHHPTKGNKKGDKGRQDLGKTDTPSNTGKPEGVQWETMGDNGRQGPRPSGRRTHHPTKAKKKKGCNGRQNSQEGGHTIQQRESRRGIWETRGDKTLGKADTPSNKRKQELRQGETRENTTPGRRTYHPTI